VIALYKGVSKPSRIIRAFNWSEYSHAAWVDDDGSVYQAWSKGVTLTRSISEDHTPGTEVHLYTVIGETPETREEVRKFMISQLGKKYDWLGILGFVFRAKSLHRRTKWFCSELVAEAYASAAHPLVRAPSFKVYPGMLAASPLLKHTGGMITS
jgi:uncharacterized protein YycO